MCVYANLIYIFFLSAFVVALVVVIVGGCGAGFVFVRASRRSPRQFFSINVATIW